MTVRIELEFPNPGAALAWFDAAKLARWVPANADLEHVATVAGIPTYASRRDDDLRPHAPKLRDQLNTDPLVEWAVQHPDVITTPHTSPASVLFTYSRIPGGVLVRRVNRGPWAETSVDAVRADLGRQEASA